MVQLWHLLHFKVLLGPKYLSVIFVSGPDLQQLLNLVLTLDLFGSLFKLLLLELLFNPSIVNVHSWFSIHIYGYYSILHWLLLILWNLLETSKIIEGEKHDSSRGERSAGIFSNESLFESFILFKIDAVGVWSLLERLNKFIISWVRSNDQICWYCGQYSTGAKDWDLNGNDVFLKSHAIFSTLEGFVSKRSCWC